MTSKLIYEGSVKNLYEASRAELEFEYTDAYSVFDWGRMPDQLPGKGESLAALGAYFFEAASRPETWREAGLGTSSWLRGFDETLRRALRGEIAELEREGFAHHFIKRASKNRLTVRRVDVVPPVTEKFGGQTLYCYAKRGWEEPRRLLPLEVVFRFGMPKGSSLLDRLTPAYARQLGLERVPREGERFTRPVIEFFSKLEDTDRFLTWEQALNYSGMDFAIFERLVARSLCLAVWLAQVFEARGLELWDGKFEWALFDGRLTLVDSIGPDELRLVDPKSGVQISKEFLRLFYRKTKWFEATKAAKVEAEADPAMDWKQLVRARAGDPPPLSKEFREAAMALYPSLALAFCGENPEGLGLALPLMLERIEKCLAN